MKRIFVLLPGTVDACTYYRSILPWRFCREPLLQEGIELCLDSTLTEKSTFDGYFFTRIVAKHFLTKLGAIKASGAKIGFNTDDALDQVPEWSAAELSKETVALYQFGLAFADRIAISTAPLARHIGLPEKIIVAPNLIDPSVFPKREPREEDGPVRILWAGTNTHKQDVALLIEPVQRLIREFGDKIVFYFFGYIHPELLAEHFGKGNVYYQMWVDPQDYIRVLCNFRPHIALCPLASEPFNESKSNIKWMEMTLAGAAVVASDFGPYQCIDHGVDGLLTGDDRWYDAIEELILDRESRGQLMRRATQRILEEFAGTSSRARSPWMQFFREIAG